MGNDSFTFRQFTVRHDRCAHKVGTDGVLLGAWAHVDGCRHVLDIGCGSGVVSLMVAQRNATAQVCGVELDARSARQAAENVASSPFADRVTIREADIREFCGQFDCIVCNPPFFTEDTLSPDSGRATARSAVSLTYEELWNAVGKVSVDKAFFTTILPYERFVQFNIQAVRCGFGMLRLCHVQTKEAKPPKRILVTYRKGNVGLVEDSRLVLQRADGMPTDEYAWLTRDFYLFAT